MLALKARNKPFVGVSVGPTRLRARKGSATRNPGFGPRRACALDGPGPACFSRTAPVRGHSIGRVDVAEPASISYGIAARYATAVFELAQEQNALDALEADIGTLDAILKESADFRTMITSPLYSRDAEKNAVMAVAGKAGLTDVMSRTLGLMADHRRLFTLPQFVTELRDMIKRAKNEVTAEVISAQPLTEDQVQRLETVLTAKADGRKVLINTTVDDTLIGGLVVKLGSKMIDTSVRSKLSALQNAMKEVG